MDHPFGLRPPLKGRHQRTGGAGSAVSAWSRPITRLLCTLALAAATVGAGAAPLRIASGFDPQTMDPHALALLYQTRVVTQIYESLVNYNEKFELEGSLAVSWQALNPTTWRFKLRPGVVFHDGAPFTADDAVFSLER